MRNFFEELANFDKEVYDACDLELGRQQHNIEQLHEDSIHAEVNV